MNQSCTVTAEQIKDARGWIADVWGAKLARKLTASEVVAGIARHYEGGWAQFIADAA